MTVSRNHGEKLFEKKYIRDFKLKIVETAIHWYPLDYVKLHNRDIPRLFSQVLIIKIGNTLLQPADYSNRGTKNLKGYLKMTNNPTQYT